MVTSTAPYLPLGISDTEGLERVLQYPAPAQQVWVTDHEPTGVNLVLAGLVLARDGEAFELAYRFYWNLSHHLKGGRESIFSVWQWLARGYRLHHGDDWHDPFFASGAHHVLMRSGLRVERLDAQLRVPLRAPAVFQHLNDHPAAVRLQPGAEVLITEREHISPSGVYRNQDGVHVFDRILTPAVPATEDEVAQTYDIFHLGQYV